VVSDAPPETFGNPEDQVSPMPNQSNSGSTISFGTRWTNSGSVGSNMLAEYGTYAQHSNGHAFGRISCINPTKSCTSTAFNFRTFV